MNHTVKVPMFEGFEPEPEMRAPKAGDFVIDLNGSLIDAGHHVWNGPCVIYRRVKPQRWRAEKDGAYATVDTCKGVPVVEQWIEYKASCDFNHYNSGNYFRPSSGKAHLLRDMWQRALDQVKALPPEDEDGWMTWNGGPCPVPEWCRVEVRKNWGTAECAPKEFNWPLVKCFRLAKREEGR